MERKIALVGLIINIFLAVIKIVVGILSKSSAILAEGLHSGMDVFSSGVSYIGIKISKKPPDRKHPYGHYKAEVISGFLIAIILSLTALGIIYESIVSFFNPKTILLTYWSFGVMIFSAIINEIIARVKIKYGKKYDNISLISDGVHNRVDVLTSIAVIVGLVLSKYFVHSDSIFALIIGVYILKESYNIGKESGDILLDVSAGEEVENKIKEIIKKEKIEIKELKTQKRGSKIFAHINIVLPSNLKVDEVSIITKKLEKKLTDNIENLDYVVIQISPYDISESYYRGTLMTDLRWRRKGKMHGKALGPGGYCICPNCGYRTEHKRGTPCSSLICPNCKVNLEREEYAETKKI